MREKRPNSLKTTFIVLAILLAIIAVIAVWRYALTGDTADNMADPIPESSEQETSGTNTQDGTASNPAVDETPTAPEPDPATFSSIVIESENIELYYTKGIPGFEYRVLRTSSGTTYIEFATEGLIGTKCTDDDGVFASVIKNPSETEAQTVTTITKVGDDSYGLSLASDTCTGDAKLLGEYQAAFKSGFGSLRAVDE